MRQSFLILAVLFTLLACNKPKKYYAPGITNEVVNSFYFSGRFNDSNVYQNVSWYYEGINNQHSLSDTSRGIWLRVDFSKDRNGSQPVFHPEGNKYYFLDAFSFEFVFNLSVPLLRKNLGKMYKLDSTWRLREMNLKSFNLITKRGRDFYSLSRRDTDSIQCLELKDTFAMGHKYCIYTFRIPKLLFTGDFLIPIELTDFRIRYLYRKESW